MDACEPRARHRGFFLHSETVGDHDAGEHENPEGIAVRVNVAHPPRAHRRSGGGAGTTERLRFSGGGRSRTESPADNDLPRIRSGSVTGSRQRADSPR